MTAHAHNFLETDGAFPGLVWGYAFDAEGRASVITDRPVHDLASPTDGFRWLHLNLVDRRACLRLGEQRVLPAETRELFLSHEDDQRSTVIDGTLCAIVQDGVIAIGRDVEVKRARLHIVATERFIVTGRFEPLHATRALRERIDAGVRMHTPLDILRTLIRAAADRVAASKRAFDAELDTLEDELIESRAPLRASRLSAIQRQIVGLHRQVNGTRSIFQQLSDEDPHDVPEAFIKVAQSLENRLDSLLAEISALKERARLFQDDVDSRISSRINANLYLLSRLTALFLPPTLVTGIFGMNAGGHPLVETTRGFTLAMVCVLVSPVVMYLALRRSGFWSGVRRNDREH